MVSIRKTNAIFLIGILCFSFLYIFPFNTNAHFDHFCKLWSRITRTMSTSATDDAAKMSKQWTDIRKRINLTGVTLTGTDVKIGIIDTGINPHPKLEQNVHKRYNFVWGSSNWPENDNHGTHVAGIINEIAPKASLYSYKILTDNNQPTMLRTCFNRLSRALKQASIDGVNVINLSVGIPSPSFTNNLHQIIHPLIKQKITVVVAAGNEGEIGAYSISPPGNFSNVITVGFSEQNGAVSKYSSQGPALDAHETQILKPDLIAIGDEVISTTFQGNEATCDSKSGSSMSTPMVTAAVALFLEQNPDASPAQIKSALCNNATLLRKHPSKRLFEPEQQGSGQLNVKKALDSKTFIYPNNLSFNSSSTQETTKVARKLTIHNTSNHSKTYRLMIESDTLERIQLEYPSKIQISAGQTKEVILQATLPTADQVDHSLPSGFLYIYSEDEQLHVPFICTFLQFKPTEPYKLLKPRTTIKSNI